MPPGLIFGVIGLVALPSGAWLWHTDATDTVTWCSGKLVEVSPVPDESASVITVFCENGDAPRNGPDFGGPTREPGVTGRIDDYAIGAEGLETFRRIDASVTIWTDRHEDYVIGLISTFAVHKDPVARKNDKIAVGRGIAFIGLVCLLIGAARFVKNVGRHEAG